MSYSRIAAFDTWQQGYGGASVAVYLAGTDTLASVYFDTALTDAAPNPITLASRSFGGINYGKFAAPVYVGAAVELRIGADQTGIIGVPLTTLDGEDASAAVATADGGSEEFTVAEFLGRSVNVLDYGEFLPTSSDADSASTNNASLTAAIAAVSALGGGYALAPAGTYLATQVNIPTGVIVKGAGDGVTIIQSTVAGAVVTLGGDGAGFEDITWDGVSQVSGSTGLYSKANDHTRIRRATVKRFETNVHMIGGRRNDWQDFTVDTGVTGAKLHGDLDTSGGDSFLHNKWTGRVTAHTTVGVELKYVTMTCWHNELGIAFESNTGVALRVYGARHTDLRGSWFNGNTNDLEILDGTDAAFDYENTVVGFHMQGGSVEADMDFTGKCQDIVFEKVNFEGGTFTLTSVDNNILALDCIEDSSVVLAGNDAKAWLRARSILGDAPQSFGQTTDAVATEAYVYDLAPGERVVLDATVIGNSRNSNEYGVYRILQGVHRPVSTLAYDGQTVNFAAGLTLTGATSGATALIVADADSGATGTLSLRDIDGEFVDNETISDSSGGTALANGTMAHQNAALLGSITSLMAAVESDAAWAAIFGVTGGSARVLVTGAAAKTVEWTVAVRVTSSG